MASEKFAEIEGIEMDREAVDEFLREQGRGILSLTDGREGYGVPVSFGYDSEDSLYFVFLRVGEQSKKEQFAKQTERASLTVYDVTSKHVWTSVIASGSLRQIADDEWNELYAAIEDNAWYPSLFSEAEPMQDIQGWELRIEDVTGQYSEG
ncbi:MAG TPA: pyridoxamine 5'-phosphate oxidase family protein [Halococcus sp.]|nr:pyridoxamine 5'-phosphate oxidase family protein [Halococcus sp.]